MNNSRCTTETKKLHEKTDSFLACLGHAAVTIDDHTLWFFGGIGEIDIKTNVIAYDIQSDAVSAVTIPNIPALAYHSAVKIKDRIYLIGGYKGLSADWYDLQNYSNTVYVIDIRMYDERDFFLI